MQRNELCNFFSHRCKVCRNWMHFISIKTIQIANSLVVIFHVLFESFQCINSWHLHKNLTPFLKKGELRYRKVKSLAWLARGRSRIRTQAVCPPSPHSLMLLTSWAMLFLESSFKVMCFRDKMKPLQSNTMKRSATQFKDSIQLSYFNGGMLMGRVCLVSIGAGIMWVCFHQAMDRFHKTKH